MNNNDFDIPVKIEVDTNEGKNRLGKVGSFLLGHAVEMMFGKRGLIRPEFETTFWLGNYYIKIDMH